MRYNGKNFLRWRGNFATPAYTVVAIDDSTTIAAGDPSVSFNPLANDTATYGKDRFSFEVLTVGYPAPTPSWDPLFLGVGRLTIYRPYSPNENAVDFQIAYQFRDNLGHVSNVGLISISLPV